MKRTIVIGLGNPGEEFSGTYHNIGMMAVRSIAGGFEWKRYKKLFESAGGGDAKFILPLVYMNDSGRAAAAALKKFGVGPENLVVIHDDSDLPVGDWKISVGRGSAGHKGVGSIIENLGTNAFKRIRIGVRNPRERTRRPAGDFVLRKIAPRDLEALEKVFSSIDILPE